MVLLISALLSLGTFHLIDAQYPPRTRDCSTVICPVVSCGNPTIPNGGCCPQCPSPPPHCAMIQCDIPACPNPVVRPDQCCPECPVIKPPHCAAVLCQLPPCPNPVVRPGQCCPECPVIEPPNCAARFCPLPTCPNPIRRPGECCMECPDQSCYHNGVTYADGQTFRIDCNTCTCNNGQVSCTEMACGRPCYIDGKTYADGETFKIDCNGCTCRNGRPICTLIACNTPKRGRCPRRRLDIGICVEMCSGDSDCPGAQKCCSNGCGHICMNPIGIGGSGGPIDCTLVDCPPLTCAEQYTRRNQCCPECRPTGY